MSEPAILFVLANGNPRTRAAAAHPVTFDHNVIDGAPAARFVAELRRLIEGADALHAAAG